ncbi:MAG: AAC(3) family N-acetyltransferase [Clostridia bacterium]|nr:AAC(3) family N-acetyltransferase [Clostridia bacterium]
MYDINTKVVLIGVNETKITFKHYVEYLHIENSLKAIEGMPEYEEMRAKVRRFQVPGVWVWLDSLKVFDDLDGMGLLKKTKCGNAEIIAFPCREYTDIPLKRFDNGDTYYLAYPEVNANYLEWIKKITELKEKK